MDSKKEKQTYILVIVISIIAALIVLFNIFVKEDKFIDHLLSASLALALFGTGFIHLKEMKKKE